MSIVVFHIVTLQSCSPEALNENTTQACCGNQVPPPPPPPPGDGNRNGN